MQKHEFEERIESTVSDEDYKLIEFVYQFHPVIRNVSGKDEVAELYKSFGMALLGYGVALCERNFRHGVFAIRSCDT